MTMTTSRVRLIDIATGNAPILHAGQSFRVVMDILDGAIVPHGLTEDGQEICYVRVVETPPELRGNNELESPGYDGWHREGPINNYWQVDEP